MRAVIDHAGDRKEESRHHTMREHLHACAGKTGLIKRGQTEHHQAHVRDGREADHIFQVSLDKGNERAVHHSNDGGTT